MTPEMLQEALIEECKTLFVEDRFKAPSGELTHINMFPQNLPMVESDEDNDPAPYIIVRIVKGTDSGEADSVHKVEMLLIIGIFDMDLQAQGHRDVQHIINTIYRRFKTNPVLDNQYRQEGPIEWDIQDDSYYPYFFGALKTSFIIPAIRREDEFV